MGLNKDIHHTLYCNFRDLWVPDPYFLNQKSQERVSSFFQDLSDETFLASNRSGDELKLEHTNTIRVEVKCEMEFAQFPFDDQKCKFFIASVRKQKHLVWDRASLEWSPVHFDHPDFTVRLEQFPGLNYMVKNINTSVSGFFLVMSRKPNIFISTYFIPSGLMVVISWISFVVKMEVVPGRLGLLITLLLVMNNMSNTVTSTIPRSGTVCPLLLWIQHSMVFIALALLEYFALLYISKFSWRVKDCKENEKVPRYVQTWAQAMDKTALVIFPLVYLAYVVFFWLRWWMGKGYA